MLQPLDFHIRTATQDDVDAVVELWSELMAYHESLDERFVRGEDARVKFRTFLEINIDSEHAQVLVAQSQGAIVGYTMAQESKRPPVFAVQAIVEIMDMAVTSGYRRRGVGRVLVEEMRHWAHERGAAAIYLGAAAANPGANRFWAAVGARPYIHLLELA